MRRKFIAVAAATLGFSALFATPANGQDCNVHADITRLDYALPRTAERLMYGHSLKIVALGSSSTEGAGAQSRDNSYPARLQVELQTIYPRSQVVVINKGVGGETVQDMMLRLPAILAEKPDLLIFQPSTNTVLREQSVDAAIAKIAEAIERMREAGIEVMLMNDQFTPVVEGKRHAHEMRARMEFLVRSQSISMFRRNELMRAWHMQDNLPFAVTAHSDGIHMIDWSYRCLARSIARAVQDAASRAPVYTSLMP